MRSGERYDWVMKPSAERIRMVMKRFMRAPPKISGGPERITYKITRRSGKTMTGKNSIRWFSIFTFHFLSRVLVFSRSDFPTAWVRLRDRIAIFENFVKPDGEFTKNSLCLEMCAGWQVQVDNMQIMIRAVYSTKNYFKSFWFAPTPPPLVILGKWTLPTSPPLPSPSPNP